MLQIKLLLFFAVFAIFGSTPIFPTPVDPVEYWNHNSLEVLTDLVEAVLNHTGNGVKVIASQNIHDTNGSIKEIRTLELAIPNVLHRGFGSKNIFPEYLDKLKANDDEFGDTLLKMQADFRTASEKEHYDKQAAYLKQTKTGEVELELFVSKNEAFYQDDEGLGYYLRDNIFATDDKNNLLEELLKRFKNRNTTLYSILVWDKDDKFASNESRIEPRLLVYVDDASDDANERMLDFAVEQLSKCILTYPPDKVPEELSRAMSQSYPTYIWFVTKWQWNNVDNAKYDVFIKLTYDNVRVEEIPLEYTLYGVQNEE